MFLEGAFAVQRAIQVQDPGVREAAHARVRALIGTGTAMPAGRGSAGVRKRF